MLSIESLEGRALFAVSIQPGYSSDPIVTGLSAPTDVVAAPDGRLFISQQSGDIRIVKNGALLPTPFASVTTVAVGEQGLSSVFLDPNFSSNHYVYAYYTAQTPTLHNVLVRFTADGDTAAPDATITLLDLPDLQTIVHMGGAIAFGPDGKLYLSVGDNGNGNNAPSLSTPLGKVLRLNPDGSTPTDNPFYNQTTGINQLIFARGLRNPYTMTFEPGSSRLFVNDVGENTWEEINIALGGEDFGWVATEGPTSDPNYNTPFYAYQHTSFNAIVGGAFYRGQYYFVDFSGFLSVIDPVTPTTPSSAPKLATGYTRATRLATDIDGTLLLLTQPGTLYRVTSLAPELTTPPAPQTVIAKHPVTFTAAATGPSLTYQWLRDGAPIDAATSASYTFAPTVADSGAMFSVTIANDFGTLTTPAATLTVTPLVVPTINLHPASSTVRVTLPTTFSATATGDNLKYQWYKGSAAIEGATDSTYTIAATTLTSAGIYTVRVTNDDGIAASDTVTSDPAILTIDPNRIAVPVIQTSTKKAITFSAGQKITLNFSATDPDQKSVPLTVYSYQLFISQNAALSPFAPAVTKKKTATLTLPATSASSLDLFYRVVFTVTDDKGLPASTSMDFYPKLTTITLTSTLTNLPLVSGTASLSSTSLVAGQPTTFTAIAGTTQSIAFPTYLFRDGTTYKLLRSEGIPLRAGQLLFKTPEKPTIINLVFKPLK